MNFFVAALLPGSYARSTKHPCLVHCEQKKLDDVPDSQCVAHGSAPRARANEHISA